jgi:hypothetical protein
MMYTIARNDRGASAPALQYHGSLSCSVTVPTRHVVVISMAGMWDIEVIHVGRGFNLATAQHLILSELAFDFMCMYRAVIQTAVLR